MARPREECLIALGANQPSVVGAPLATLRKALSLLARGGVSVDSTARWRRTPAWPAGAGPEFVNGAARIGFAGSPAELLALLHEVERAMGRKRGVRWGPRTCDLDLIAVGRQVLPDEATARAAAVAEPSDRAPGGLILPHPRMAERAFVLAPLADVAPNWRHPLTGLTVAQMLAALPQSDLDDVKVLNDV